MRTKRPDHPEPLAESEWAFHKVPKEHLRYCALWEMSRLRGRKREPWLDLSKEAKQQFIVQADGSGLQEIPVNACAAVSATVRRYPHLVEQGASALRVVAFLVDFQEREGTLRELFRLWLKGSRHHKKWREKSKPPPDRWKSILSDIVILRAEEAGMKRKVAKEAFSALWKKWGYYGASEGKLSAPHWSRAIKKAKALRQQIEGVAADPPYGAPAHAFEIRLKGMSTFVPLSSKV